MTMPGFTAQASAYTTRNRYRSFGGDFGGSIADESIVAAYIPGAETQNKCSGCTDLCALFRDGCLAEVATVVAESCLLSIGFGCGAAIAWGAQQTASCHAYVYAPCIGYCAIPDLGSVNLNVFGVGNVKIPTGMCCPKVCGPPEPWNGPAGGCCDHGETCKGLGMQENTRDGCCPVGQDCGSVCCAPGEKCCGQICCPQDYFCVDDHTCNPPGFPHNPPPPPPKGNDGCYLFAGGSPCGPTKCCYDSLQCCGIDANGLPICKTNCGPN